MNESSRTRTSFTILALAALVVAVLAIACGDDDDVGERAPSATPSVGSLGASVTFAEPWALSGGDMLVVASHESLPPRSERFPDRIDIVRGGPGSPAIETVAVATDFGFADFTSVAATADAASIAASGCTRGCGFEPADDAATTLIISTDAGATWDRFDLDGSLWAVGFVEESLLLRRIAPGGVVSYRLHPSGAAVAPPASAGDGAAFVDAQDGVVWYGRDGSLIAADGTVLFTPGLPMATTGGTPEILAAAPLPGGRFAVEWSGGDCPEGQSCVALFEPDGTLTERFDAQRLLLAPVEAPSPLVYVHLPQDGSYAPAAALPQPFVQPVPALLDATTRAVRPLELALQPEYLGREIRVISLR